ncbi:MAG: hypothetical protein E7523_04345 [Ruminococcaceae bacterium]|nr:hypothetical protein [Oscillospiraceae bacterium]
MRKIKVFILVACFIALFCLFANAAQTDVQIGSVQAQAGDRVNISVSLVQPLEIKSMYFAVDCKNRELLPGTAKWQFSGAILKEWDKNTADGVIAFSTQKTAEGKILQLSVNIPADTAVGDYVLSGVCTMQNEKGKTVTLQVADGIISVVEQASEPNEEIGVITDNPSAPTEQASAAATTSVDTTSVITTTAGEPAATEKTTAATTVAIASSDADTEVTESGNISQTENTDSANATAESGSGADTGTEPVEQATTRQEYADTKLQNDSGQQKIMLGVVLTVLLFAVAAFALIRFRKNR